MLTVDLLFPTSNPISLFGLGRELGEESFGGSVVSQKGMVQSDACFVRMALPRAGEGMGCRGMCDGELLGTVQNGAAC